MDTRYQEKKPTQEDSITNFNTEKIITNEEKEKAVKEYIYSSSLATVRMNWDNYKPAIERELILLKETNLFISVMLNFLWRQMQLAIKQELQKNWLEEQEKLLIQFVSDFPFAITIDKEINRLDEMMIIEKKYIIAFTPKDFDKPNNEQNITSAMEKNRFNQGTEKSNIIIKKCKDLKIFFETTLFAINTKFEKTNDCFFIIKQLLALQESYRIKIKDFSEINACLAKESEYTRVILGIEQKFHDIYMQGTAKTDLPRKIILDNILQLKQMVKIPQKDIDIFYNALYEFKLFEKAKELNGKSFTFPLLDDIYPIFFPEKQKKLHAKKVINEMSPGKITKQIHLLDLTEVPEVNDEVEPYAKTLFIPITDKEINEIEKDIRKSFLEAGILAYKQEQPVIQLKTSKTSLAVTEEFILPTNQEFQEFKRRAKSTNYKSKKIYSFNLSKAFPQRIPSKLNENFAREEKTHSPKKTPDTELTPPTKPRHRTFAQKLSPNQGKKKKTSTYTESSSISVSPPSPASPIRKITSSDNIKTPAVKQPYNLSHSPISPKRKEGKGYLSLFVDESMSPRLPKKSYSSKEKPIIYAENTSSKEKVPYVQEKPQRPKGSKLLRARSGNINLKKSFLEKIPKDRPGDNVTSIKKLPDKPTEITIDDKPLYPIKVPQITRRKPVTQTFDDNISTHKAKSSPDILSKLPKEIKKEERRKSIHPSSSSQKFFQTPPNNLQMTGPIQPTSISQEIRIPTLEESDKSSTLDEEKTMSRTIRKN